MKHRTYFAGIAGLVASLATVGCDSILDIISLSTVTVSLVNDSDFVIEVELYYDDEQDLPEVVLTEIGTKREFTIAAGDTTTFIESCDDLQVIVINDADLLVLGGIGPEANSDVIRDGHDFGCGDTIVFTFSHSDVIFDFDVSEDVQ